MGLRPQRRRRHLTPGCGDAGRLGRRPPGRGGDGTMVRVRMTPKRRSDALLILGVLLLAVGAALIYIPAGLIVAGAAAVLSGLFLVNVEGARESTSARPKQPLG